MANAPLYTKQTLAFDPSILYYGRPVKLAGEDEEGETLNGNWLIFHCEAERVVLRNSNGAERSIHINEVLADEYPAIIIPYPEVTAE